MYSNSKFERNKANVDISESHSEIQFPFGVEPNMNSKFSWEWAILENLQVPL